MHVAEHLSRTSTLFRRAIPQICGTEICGVKPTRLVQKVKPWSNSKPSLACSLGSLAVVSMRSSVQALTNDNHSISQAREPKSTSHNAITPPGPSPEFVSHIPAERPAHHGIAQAPEARTLLRLSPSHGLPRARRSQGFPPGSG